MTYTSERSTGPAVAMTKCYYCGEDDTILLQSKNIRYPDRRIEAAHGKVIDMRPCSKCQGYMKKGIILITISTELSEKDWFKAPTDPEARKRWIPNPYRTGGFMVVKEEEMKRAFNDAGGVVSWALKHRWTFIEHAVAERIGLLEAAKSAPQE